MPLLAQLVSERQKLARKLGHPSYAHLMLQDKIMQTPVEVTAMLYSVAKGVAPIATEEVKELLKLKQSLEGDVGKGIEQWDLNYFLNVVKSVDSADIQAREHLPLKKCIAGLCLLTEKLFGVRVDRSIAPNNESWDGMIEKLTLHHPEQGMLGTIYLDLHPRPYKFGHSAHFTVSCGCETSTTKSQSPVVALVMNFMNNSGNSCYLTHGELETLLHEYGHALHSLLSRTKYQHLSGTRVSSDFVETPSQLFENFAWDVNSLTLFSGHPMTGRPIEPDLLKSLERAKNHFQALAILHQVFLALFDLEVYQMMGDRGVTEEEVTEEAIAQLAHDLHVKIMPKEMPPPVGVNWPNRFSHLTTYGATYYTYILNEAYATHLWEHLFARDPLSRSSGEKLWRELLRPGGSKDPTELLTGCLDGNTISLEPFFKTIGIKK
jgi:mitochondrial intermediate peptidase